MRHLILVGPSAVGKTTVMACLLARSTELTPIRSMTTRPARFAGDTEYLHVDEATFSAAVARGELLEHMRYGDYAYGTPRCEMERAEAAGKRALLILDLVGARALKRALGDGVFTVYLFDALNVMEERLYARELAHNPSPEAFARFVKRKEANVRDYLGLADDVDMLDLLVENTAPPEETADSILRALTSYDVTSTEEKAVAVARLRAEALEKQNYRA